MNIALTSQLLLNVKLEQLYVHLYVIGISDLACTDVYIVPDYTSSKPVQLEQKQNHGNFVLRTFGNVLWVMRNKT